MKNHIGIILFSVLLPFSSSCQVKPSEMVDGDILEASVEDISIAFDVSIYQLERGAYLTLKANVAIANDSISKAVSFSLEQESNIVSFVDDKDTSSDGTISLLGKNLGKATLKATCLANKEVSCSVEIEVIQHIPALNKVWQNINELNNYTLANYKVSKEDETKAIPSSQIIVTENAVLFEGLVYDEDEEGYYPTPVFSYSGADAYLLGYGIDQNGYAFPIVLSSDGQVYNDNVIAKTERGFLTRENFLGFKEDSFSMNDVGIFYGLQAINPSWLSKSKTVKNVYEITGTEDDLSSYYVKYLLWGLIDPVGRLLYSSLHPEEKSIVNLVDCFDLKIKANTIQSVSFSLTYKDGTYINGEEENYQYISYMKDIGTTDCSSVNGLEDYLSGVSASLPPLVKQLELLQTKIDENNYVFQREIYWKNPTTNKFFQASFMVFYTKDYIMAYYSKELCDLMEMAGNEKMNPYGFGYMKKSDGIYLFEYQPYKESNMITLVSKEENTENIQPWQVDYNLTKKYKIPNYLSTSDYILNHGLNVLSDSEITIFNGLPTYHYTRSESISKDFLSWYLGETTIDSENAYHGIHIDMNGNEISSVQFLYAYQSEYDNYQLLYTPTLSSFGTAESKNPADKYIQEKLA